MANKLDTYRVGEHTVLGRTFFVPPFKISDSLKNEARIVYVVKGRSRLYSADYTQNVSSGDCFLMKCDNFVNQWIENEDNTPNEVIVFQLYPELLQRIYNNKLPEFFLSKKDLNVNPVEVVQSSNLLKTYIENLRFYLDQSNQINEELIQIKIRELLLILSNTDISGRIRALLGELFQAKEYDFQEVIATHLYENLNLDDLAFFTGMSLSSFKRKFKSIYGTSPTKYIVSKRLEKAQTLLATSELRLSDIAYECGFNDIGYFSKTFRNYYNISPTDFKNKHLNG